MIAYWCGMTAPLWGEALKASYYASHASAARRGCAVPSKTALTSNTSNPRNTYRTSFMRALELLPLNGCNGNGLSVPLACCGRLLGERPQQHEFGLEDRGRALRVTRHSHVDSEVPVRNCTSIVHLKGKTVKGKRAIRRTVLCALSA